MTHLGLFEGIGGFSLAAKWMSWETKAWCEWNEFAQKILRYHFPNAEGFGDITKTDFTKYAHTIDIVTGGFPCQPYSIAGKRKGKEDNRHLWPEMLRAIREIQPRWVVGENVSGLINWNGGMVFHEVQTNLEAAGYEVWPYVLPACAINAPHRRDRVWLIAYSNSFRMRDKTAKYCGQEGGNTNSLESKILQQEYRSSLQQKPKTNHSFATNTNSNKRCKGRLYTPKQEKAKRHISTFNTWDDRGNWQNFPTQSPLSSELAGVTFSKHRNESIKAYGNAIVPQVALQIFKAIEQLQLL